MILKSVLVILWTLILFHIIDTISIAVYHKQPDDLIPFGLFFIIFCGGMIYYLGNIFIINYLDKKKYKNN